MKETRVRRRDQRLARFSVPDTMKLSQTGQRITSRLKSHFLDSNRANVTNKSNDTSLQNVIDGPTVLIV